jgi:hypothetical protein
MKNAPKNNSKVSDVASGARAGMHMHVKPFLQRLLQAATTRC